MSQRRCRSGGHDPRRGRVAGTQSDLRSRWWSLRGSVGGTTGSTTGPTSRRTCHLNTWTGRPRGASSPPRNWAATTRTASSSGSARRAVRSRRARPSRPGARQRALLRFDSDRGTPATGAEPRATPCGRHRHRAARAVLARLARLADRRAAHEGHRRHAVDPVASVNRRCKGSGTERCTAATTDTRP